METGNKIAVVQSSVNSNFHYTDESFNSSRSAHGYHLSIELGLLSFSYAVLDVQAKKYVVWGREGHEYSDIDSLVSKLSYFLKNIDFLSSEYRSSSIAYCGFSSTLVPNIYADETKEMELFAFNHQEDSGQICTDNLLNLEAKQIYSVPEKLVQWINQIWPKSTTLHLGSVLIEQLVVFSKSVDKICVYANLKDAKMDLIIADNGQLKLYNSFGYMTSDDVVYYILFALEQLEIRNYQVELTLLGDIDSHGNLEELLSDYVKEVSFAKTQNRIELSSSFKQPSHVGFSLFNQYLCV
ncbi:MAG: DUF3822 family protein [Flavobacteriales bacterium]|nr:DUF3822 family protein [Flavobacteriales bacterium]